MSLPDRPSLEQLRKQAKELLRDARGGDAGAVARIVASTPRASEQPLLLAHAQLAIAREHGFSTWPRLVDHVRSVARDFALRPLIRPVELEPGRLWELPDRSRAPTDDVFGVFVAARAGDLTTVRRFVRRTPVLATVEYNYTPPIHFAVREGYAHITEFLLDHGADPAYRSYPFQESLLTFAEDRAHHDVAELLRRTLARRFALAPGTEAIIGVAGRGDLAGVEMELARDAGLARAANETGDGYRPVHCALMPNWFFHHHPGPRDRVADLLLARGAEYNIFVAALRGDDDFVADALARDPALANFEDTCHHRVLSAAVRRGDLGMTRMLLTHGADPNLPEEGAPRGLSLWIAVNDGRSDLVELLLEHGADPNAPVDSAGTPTEKAGRDTPLAELLRRHGGRHDRSQRDRVGELLKRGRLEEAERLLRANPEWMEGDWGDGILAGPAREGRNDVIALLMGLGATVPMVSKWAPYYYFKHEATAAFLLENGMDPDHMNWHRFTLLHHMAAEGELGKARLLLDHGANLDAIDDEYRSTPLGVAARWGRREMVEVLLQRGADPGAAGADWARPVAWAEKKGHDEVAATLRRAMVARKGPTGGS